MNRSNFSPFSSGTNSSSRSFDQFPGRLSIPIMSMGSILNNNGPSESSTPSPGPSSKPMKSRKKACDNCVKRKSRCDRNEPCKACILHNTQSTCQAIGNHQLEENSNTARKSRIQSCSNCIQRKSNCDQGEPCSSCISGKLGNFCYYEIDSDRPTSGPIRNKSGKGKEKMIPKKRKISQGGIDETNGDAPIFSKHACFNCWHRKTKCSKQKPCSFCIFHGTVDTCYIEFDDENSELAKQIRQKMAAKKQARAKGKILINVESLLNDTPSQSTSRSPNLSGTHSVLSQQEQPLFIYNNHGQSTISPPSTSGSNSYYSTTETSSYIPNDPSPYEVTISQSISKLPPLHDMKYIFSLIGDVVYGGNWPIIDRERLEMTLKKIEGSERVDAIELAYVYTLLASCSICLPLLNPYKLTGKVLHKKNLQSLLDESIRLINLKDSIVKESVSILDPSSVLFECRVFQTMAFNHHSAKQEETAFHFGERAISTARSINILQGFSDDDEKYDLTQRRFRNDCRDLAIEMYVSAKAIQVRSFLPSSITPLSEDLQRRIKVYMDETDPLVGAWAYWRTISAVRLDQSISYLRKIEEKGKDGKYLLTLEQKDAIAKSLLKKMKKDDDEFNKKAGFLLEKIEGVLVDDVIENARLVRLNHLKCAKQYGGKFLYNLIASSAFKTGSKDIFLLNSALETVYGLIEEMPLFVDLQKSQFHFTPHQTQIRNCTEMAMKIVFDAICRIDFIQSDRKLTIKMSKLLRIIPKTFDLMNNYGLTGPFSLAVASTFKPTPIKRPLSLIIKNDDNKIQEIITSEDKEIDQRKDKWKSISSEQGMYNLFLQQQLQHLTFHERPTINSLLNPVPSNYVNRKPRIGHNRNLY